MENKIIVGHFQKKKKKLTNLIFGNWILYSIIIQFNIFLKIIITKNVFTKSKIVYNVRITKIVVRDDIRSEDWM